ncbi:hypothetical protein BDR07DRAFT_1483030 [Suillus spraguei]|nr:hypothetical protein BDR07DRAFT_1483030 [Suillus spraguei]
MVLGFEDTIGRMIQGLDGRRKFAFQAVEDGKTSKIGGWVLDQQKQTILCSATIREDVQTLAGTTLIRPLVIKGLDKERAEDSAALAKHDNERAATTRSSLHHHNSPTKTHCSSQDASCRTSPLTACSDTRVEIVVFFTCTESVDFYWRLLGDSSMTVKRLNTLNLTKQRRLDLRPRGSLPTPIHLASLRGFSAIPSSKSKKLAPASFILLCTSLASRGLDLPLVRAVIQHDLPTEGGATEYVHRVGRKARAGKGGEVWSTVAPSESEWVKWVEGKMRGDMTGGTSDGDKANITLGGASVESVLAKGFGGKGYEQRHIRQKCSFLLSGGFCIAKR